MSGNDSMCIISLSKPDRIKLHYVGVYKYEDFVAAVAKLRAAILENWSAGIQNEIENYYGGHEFKLWKNPWIAAENAEAIESRRLLCGILQCMAQLGWGIVESGDIGSQGHDKDTLFFAKGAKSEDTQLFCISFNLTDRIRLINPPNELIVDEFKYIVATQCPYGTQHTREYFGAIEMKLVGNPWSPSSTQESVATKCMLCKLLMAFRRKGYQLYASIKHSSRGESGHHKEHYLPSWILKKH